MNQTDVGTKAISTSVIVISSDTMAHYGTALNCSVSSAFLFYGVDTHNLW